MPVGEYMMKVKNSLNTYSEEITDRYLDSKKSIINVSSEIEVQYNWVDGRRTNEIAGYKLYFVQEGVIPFAVKFKDTPTLPPFLAEVKFEALEAIEIQSHVYFRAEAVKVEK